MDLENIIDDIRDKFAWVDECPYTGKRIFLENAGGALTLKSVVDTSAKYAAIPDNGGRPNPASQALGAVMNRARNDIRDFFNVNDGVVFVGESGTELLFRIIGAAVLSQPQPCQVIGSSFEHPATRSACAHWAKKGEGDYIQIVHDAEAGLVEAAAYSSQVTDKTAVATILHTSPVTGMTVDLPAIAHAIRAVAPDCFIIVDGIQHAAHGAVDVAACGIDAYVISAYKVFSRHGYGVAWISDRLAQLPHCQLAGTDPEQWELGTRDAGAYATFSDVVSYLDWLGSTQTKDNDRRQRLRAAGRAIAAHEQRLVHILLHGNNQAAGLLARDDLVLVGNAAETAREGLVTFALKNILALDVVQHFEAHNIRVHIRRADHYSSNILTPLGLQECIRVSMCHYNTSAEMTAFLQALQKLPAAG